MTYNKPRMDKIKKRKNESERKLINHVTKTIIPWFAFTVGI